MLARRISAGLSLTSVVSAVWVICVISPPTPHFLSGQSPLPHAEVGSNTRFYSAVGDLEALMSGSSAVVTASAESRDVRIRPARSSRSGSQRMQVLAGAEFRYFQDPPGFADPHSPEYRPFTTNPEDTGGENRRLTEPVQSLPPEAEQDLADLISKTLTLRYGDPLTARVLRTISREQALDLFDEVSRKIDERALEPTPYAARMQRALQNLKQAPDNSEFCEATGIVVASHQASRFREALSRLTVAEEIQVLSAASRLLQESGRLAERTLGLAAHIVGFEFTSASLDTLDRFSGLELQDPSRPSVESAMRADGLEEQIVGIGIEIRETRDGLLIVRTLRGSPADDAGIRAGDFLIGVNEHDLSGYNLISVVDLMNGPKGSVIRIQTRRGRQDVREFALTRRTVRVWTVHDVQMLPGTEVGYLSFSRFSAKSSEEVDAALDKLHQDGMKSLIFDVRGNPGGLLTTSVEIADKFLACGTIVSTRGRLSSDNMSQSATYARTWSVPLVVLIDHDSASASEIFAAAIQENHRGLVVGTRSWGKGAVQTHFPLTAIDATLRLTTALFYSPSGRRMTGRGVFPDVEVPDPDGPLNGDPALDEAIRVAQRQELRDLARAAGHCQPAHSDEIQHSSLQGIVDPAHPKLMIF